MSRVHAAQKKMSAKKKVAAITAIVLSIALLVGGAFAWTDFSQNFINRWRGTSDNDALLHDDYTVGGPDKDVYVENPGQNPILVRVQFAEFFQIGNNVLVGNDANDKDQWEIHKYLGDPCNDCGEVCHEYFTWNMSGAAKNYRPGTQELEWYASYDNSAVGVTTGPNGQLIKATVDAQAPILMSDWVDAASAATPSSAQQAILDAAENGCWILDDTDENGWAYWSKLLEGGQATNLLLNGVSYNEEIDDNWAYFIDVRMESTNFTERGKFENLTSGATALVNGFAPEALTVAGIALAATSAQPTTFTEGDLLSTSGLKLEVTYSDGSKKTISSGFSTSPAKNAPLSLTDTEVVVSYNGLSTSYPITVNNAPITVASIAVVSDPDKTTYTEGESFDPTGMEIEITYSDGTTELVAAADFAGKGVSFSPSGALAMSDTGITVSFGGEDTTYPITVEEDLLLETNINEIDPDDTEDEEELSGMLWGGSDSVFPGHIYVYLRRVPAEGSELADPSDPAWLDRQGSYPISKIIPDYQTGDTVGVNIVSAAIVRYDTGARIAFSPNDTIGSIVVDANGKLRPYIAPNASTLSTYLAGGGLGSKVDNLTTEYIIEFTLDGKTSEEFTLRLDNKSSDLQGTW